MSSPLEQNTMMGDLMLRRSTRIPSEVRNSPLVSLFPTNNWSAIHCISSALSSTGLPHHFSNSRKRGASVSKGKRRACHYHRADEIRSDGAHQHDLPAGLAVADQAGLALRFRVHLGNFGDEARLAPADVLHGLARHRVLQEANEVTGMSSLQHFADLAVMLHPTYPRALTGARIENNEWTFASFDRNRQQAA